MQQRLDANQIAPEGYKAMSGLQAYITSCGLEPLLLELVKIRASQINGCAFCMAMHTKDARKMGESDERMHLLNAWEEARVFSPRERAALAWTEALTLVTQGRVPDTVYQEARKHFSEQELVDHPYAVIAINDRLRRIASAKLCEAALAAGVQRFIQESFAPVYPDRGEQWIEESTPLQPVALNRSILDAERAAERFATGGGMGITLRFGAFYGPDAIHVRDLVRLVRRGWAPMPGRAASFISSVSHDDAGGAVVAALGAPSGIYNVVDDNPLSHRDYVDSLAAALHVAPPRLPPAWMTPIFGSVGRLLARSLRINNRKLRRETKWLPRL